VIAAIAAESPTSGVIAGSHVLTPKNIGRGIGIIDQSIE